MAEASEGAVASRPRTPPNTLRQAASAVFALTAIVPLLLFVWTVREVGALSHLRAQVALGLALAVALLGFSIFRRLMGQMSDLILTLGRVLELGERAGAQAQPRAPNVSAGSPSPPTSPPVRPSAPEATAEARSVPGLGVIQEVHDLTRTMVMLWRFEAARYEGQRVVLSVLKSPQPVAGTLIELTDDGVVLQTDSSERLAVSFTHISAIEADQSSAAK